MIKTARGRRLRHRLSRRRWLAVIAGALVLLVAAGALIGVLTRAPSIRVSAQRVSATPEAGAPVTLDTSLYLPADTPAPAILLAHGFGGSKADLDSQARSLARHGYVVLTYTARGFGASGGLIHLDAQRYEVADGSRLLDYLQARPEVLRRAGQPVLGVAGSSYGGGLALQLGALDHRISAVAADITWNDLSRALLPNGAATAGGVFKKLWAGFLFSAGFPTRGAPTGAGSDGVGAVGSSAGSTQCGRFAADVCAQYQQASGGGVLDAGFTSLLRASSPVTVLAQMKAPVLLTQGEQDSLFPLSEADANARQIAAAGAPVQVRWRSGGHDAAGAGDNVTGWQQQFFDQRLKGHGGTADPPPFLLSQAGAAISATNGRRVDSTLRADHGYPGAGGWPSDTLDLTGGPQQISAPAGGSPSVITSIPGLGDLLGTAAQTGLGGSALARVPGQAAVFSSARLAGPRLVTGSPTVWLTVDTVPGTPARPVTLFAALHDIGPDGTDTLPAQLVSPVRLPATADGHHVVQVALPWIVAQVPAGHRLAVEVSATDFAYTLPSAPATYRVALDPAHPGVAVPSIPVTTIRTGGALNWIVVAGVVVALCLLFAATRLRARRASAPVPELARVPIVIENLVKEYADGYRAVDGVSFRVEHGQVLGLLGPNGAGKTTTLRVLMGLILPTAGSIRVFGEEVVPGAAVLSRLGAFVEGPGLLPHLTGRENLRLYWGASGRPVEEAQFDTVLEIAGLGSSLERRVKTYSHGMQQRLAIAQAMLGLPEVLVLDEPTNGLDPPQIAEMRTVLHSYAATGRTVIVSSHLLAEVEQTCSHVVVMHRGQLVAAGSVAEVAGAGASQLVVPDADAALRVLEGAGIGARAVPAKRALEDVFLDLIGERND